MAKLPYLPMFWSHIPDIARMSHTTNLPQNDVGLGRLVRPILLSFGGFMTGAHGFMTGAHLEDGVRS